MAGLPDRMRLALAIAILLLFSMRIDEVDAELHQCVADREGLVGFIHQEAGG